MPEAGGPVVLRVRRDDRPAQGRPGQRGEPGREDVTRGRHLQQQHRVDGEGPARGRRRAPPQRQRLLLRRPLHGLAQEAAAEGVPDQVQVLTVPVGQHRSRPGIGPVSVEVTEQPPDDPRGVSVRAHDVRPVADTAVAAEGGQGAGGPADQHGPRTPGLEPRVAGVVVSRRRQREQPVDGRQRGVRRGLPAVDVDEQVRGPGRRGELLGEVGGETVRGDRAETAGGVLQEPAVRAEIDDTYIGTGHEGASAGSARSSRASMPQCRA